MTDGTTLEGGIANRGNVIRVGDRVHRPRGKSAAVTEALLVHLESVGYAGSPRFLGHDEQGRQVLTFVRGEVPTDQRPQWIDDDVVNARVLGRMAAFVRELHAATTGFEPPDGVEPFRPLPLPGAVWNHADVHYGNTVFRNQDPVGLIDWDCCAPGDRMYDPSTLLLSARCPKRHDAGNPRRERAAALAVASVLDGYGATDEERATFHLSVAATFDDVADFFFEADGLPAAGGSIEARNHAVNELRWQADWWRNRSG